MGSRFASTIFRYVCLSPDDFGSFYNQRDNKTPTPIRFNESLSLPETSVFLAPAQSGNDNDGLQVQLDIGRE
ncbi:hypothetical protein H6G93_38475 [Nostoc sp. FACHB-973]|nr:hypothetical protein [Nostoc sp. FACHB-973]